MISMLNKLINGLLLDAPVSWQMGFQNPATPVMEGIIWLHNYIGFYLIIVIVVVFWFLARSIFLFDESRNPELTEFNHDPVIETVWTIAPAFILVAIAIPSFSLLYSIEEVFTPAFTVKIIGHQWYWSYEFGGIRRTDNLLEYMHFFQKMKEVNDSIDAGADDEDSWYNFFNLYKLFAGNSNTDYIDLYARDPRLTSTSYFSSILREERGIVRYCHRSIYVKFFAKVVVFKQHAHMPTRVYNLSHVATIFEHLRDWTNSARFKFANVIDYLTWFKVDVYRYYGAGFKSKLPFNSFLEQARITRGSVRATFFTIIKPITVAQSAFTSIKMISPSLQFDSYMLEMDQLPLNGLRLLEVDNKLVLPVRTSIKLLITSADVIHSWAVPSFGIKMDAIPGRINQVHLFIKREGQFYGQCSELCGVNHAFMPISVKAVKFDDFVRWYIVNSNPRTIESLSDLDWEVRGPNRKTT